jgi:hypothetical protein
MAGLSEAATSLPADPNTSQTVAPSRLRDNVGKLEVSEVQNLFEADFEYGTQPMRWEQYVVNAATIVANSGLGGVTLSVTSASGDNAIRQTRPYIRYQPGKTLYMASGLLFGTAYVNQRQRVGFYDDGNGIFFEQADPTATNPSGMFVVYRSDAGGNGVVDTRIASNLWTDPQGVFAGKNPVVGAFTVNNIQMWWAEYAWYGAGMLRWGVMIGGEPYVLHTVGIGNLSGQTTAWARTGNLPVRYQITNVGASTAGSMVHYGVSVLAKGKIDAQRGFTYGYGMAAAAPTRAPASATRYPLLSIRYRAMGTLEYGVDAAYSGSNGALPTGGAAISSAASTAASSTVTLTGTPLVVNAWTGKYIFCRGSTATITGIVPSTGSAIVTTTANPNYLTIGRWVTIASATGNLTVNGTFQITAVSANTFTITAASITTGSVTGSPTYQTGQGSMGRITSNTTSVLTVVDNIQGGPMPVLPAASGNYILGIINRGQVLPQTLSIYSSANCTLELIASTYSSPIALTGGTSSNGTTFNTMYSLGSINSFVERDVTSTGLSGGEVVYNTPLPAGGLQTFDLSNFFPLYNNIQGVQPDILTVAITGTATIGSSIIAQEAMS